MGKYYIATTDAGTFLAHGPTLRETVAKIRQEREHLGPDDVDVLEVLNTTEIPVDPARYGRKPVVPREKAERFVLLRKENIDKAEKDGKCESLARMWGALRCDPDDPVEKQIEDYIESAPNEWLEPDEIVG